jgi:hypothetical protein
VRVGRHAVQLCRVGVVLLLSHHMGSSAVCDTKNHMICMSHMLAGRWSATTVQHRVALGLTV